MPSYSSLYSSRDTSNPPSKDDFTCCGHATTTTTGGCRNPILRANRFEVLRRLAYLENNAIARDDLQEELEGIAELSLCKRYHRKQAVALATYWSRSFFITAQRQNNERTPRSTTSPVQSIATPARLIVVPPAEPQPQPTANRRPHSTRSTEVDQSPAAVTSATGIRASQRPPRSDVGPALADTGLVTPPATPLATRHVTAVAVATPALAAPAIANTTLTTVAPTHPTTPVSTGITASPPAPGTSRSEGLPVHSSSAQGTPSPPEHRQRQSSSLTLARQNATTTAAGDSEASTPTPITRSNSIVCVHTAHRKAIPAAEAQCLICHDALLLTQSMLWCKNSCGQNIHKSCFDEWMTHRASQNDTTTLRCCYCRHPWDATACPCDNEPPEVEELEPTPIIEDVLTRQWPATPTRPCCNRHKPRRTLTAELTECPICQDTLSASTTMSWCKSGCGRNFHQDCWTAWREAQLVVEPGKLPRCALCRVDWDAAACACDDESLRVETATTATGAEDMFGREWLP